MKTLAGLLGVLALTFSSLAAAASPTPLRIGEQRKFDLHLDARAVGQRHEVRTVDAAFIKLHFDQFSLPEGVTLEVSSPDGQQVYRYSRQQRDGHTVDAAMGQDGRHSFSAMSIHGPVAVLRLLGNAQAPWTEKDGVRISRYLEGFPERDLPQLQAAGLLGGDVGTQSICGGNDKQPAACYASSDAAAFDRSRPVARLVMSGGGLCTAWRVGADNRMFTNNHCMASASAVAASEVWFNYQLASCGGSAATPTKVTGDQMLATNSTLDYTLFTVKNFSSITGFGYLGLDVRQPVLNEGIFIAGHPGGRQKELSVVSDRDGGQCRVNSPNSNGGGTNTDAGYYCDTEGGSSGSPVIARSSLKAIALHHLGGCYNSGAKFSLIWPQVSAHFGGVIPGGDNGGGNVPPVANFSSLANNMTVTFTDMSSDSDGNIASRSWSFGDGGSSTATNPGHTYAAAGTYTVTLTVTDNAGASNSISKTVTVGTSNLITYTNGNDVNIRDYATVESSIVVGGRTGNALAATVVGVDIKHTYIGDLKVDLVAPDGSVYVLHNRSGGSADNIIRSYTVNLSGEAKNGTWKLRVNDNAGSDIGKIDSWSITF